MSAKIQKTIARQKQKVEEGQYYEAHQQLRVIASRYVKTSDWESAVDILSQGATMLLKADQGGSGGDLCLFLMEVYNKGELEADIKNKARLLYLLRAFPKNEPTKKRFVGEMMAWSSKYSAYPAGDPELHHVAGSMFAEGKLPCALTYAVDTDSMAEGEALDAERHLVLGTNDSPGIFANMEYEWYKSDEPSTAPLYVARAVIPYLLVGNIRAANKVWLLFTSKLASTPGLSVQEVGSTSSDIRVYPSLPLMNFLGLLLLAIQRGSSDLYKTLKAQYARHIKEVGSWDDAVAQIGELYFQIKIPSQSNPLMDMMGSFLMGGGMGGGQKKQPAVKSAAPAPAPALD